MTSLAGIPEIDTGVHEISFVSKHNSSVDEGGIQIVLSGSPYLANSTDSENSKGVDARSLLGMYDQYGSYFAGKLLGCWAIALIDSNKQQLLLATDRLGRHPVYYQIGKGSVKASEDLRKLLQPGEKPKIEEQSLYNYLYFHMIPAPSSLYGDIKKLSAGHMLVFKRGTFETSRYWAPRFTESQDTPAATQQRQLKSVLQQAVGRSATGGGKVGAFLSGGLDSSTVAGMLSEIHGEGCDAYGIGFDAEGYDEMAYARITAKHFGLRLHEYYVTPEDVTDALPRVAAASPEPFGNSSALPAYFCAQMAASDGIQTLLAGDGGDELFAGNERYTAQSVFRIWQKLPVWLRSTVVGNMISGLPQQLPLVSKARSYIIQAETPLPDRLQYYSFLNTHDPASVFTPGILDNADISQPLQLLRQIYNTPKNASELNRMLFLDWQITLADNDLRKVDMACELAGVSVRYPMLDDELTELSVQIPSTRKIHRGRLRDFYKQALRGWLPDATITKGKQGFGLPFGVWMRTHKPLQELAYDNIEMLKRRGIFQPAFLDLAIDQHRQGNAAYFGELIWLLTTLELWLTANQPDYCHE